MYILFVWKGKHCLTVGIEIDSVLAAAGTGI